MKEGFTLIDSLRIPSELSNLPVVEAMIDRVCQTSGVDEDMYGNVLIAVTEAVNNAIVHGNALSREKEVKLDFFETDSGFGFTISDEGKGFDHLHLPDPTAPENLEKEHGRGIFLMRSLADDVSFNESGNEVSVFFNRKW